MADRAEATFEIVNVQGLHARPATRLVQTAAKFKCTITFEHSGQVANGKSVMGVLLLCCPKGSKLTVRADGPDSERAVAAIGELVAAKLGDTE